MRGTQILKPVRGFPLASVVLNPDYLEKTSKTNELDEAVQIDRPWVSQMLMNHMKGRAPLEPVWDFTLADFRRAFVSTMEELRLDEFLEDSVYVLRHIGASLSIHEKWHDALGTQNRGRWRAASSVRRYEKAALLQESVNRAPKEVLAYCRKCEDQLQDVVLRGAHGPAAPSFSSSSLRAPGTLRRKSAGWGTGYKPSTLPTASGKTF